MGLQETIFDAIRRSMPADAHVDISSSESRFFVSVAWRLNDDPDRPNKMSKTISIHVTHEAAQDFASAPEHIQAQVSSRIDRFLRTNLASFDPRHDTPRDKAPPVVRWDITTSTLGLHS